MAAVSNLVLEKAEAFAVRIVRLYKHLLAKGETVMSKQVLRSGTSVGANITEGHYAASKADFVNKYVIAQREAAETLYWLRILLKTEYLEDCDATRTLLADCDEIVSLLVSSIKTTRRNMERSDLHHS